MRLSFFIVVLTFISSVAHADCDAWMRKLKKILKPDTPDCLSQCAAIPSDNVIDICAWYCPNLCHSELSTDFMFRLSDLYPGLTMSERSLAARFPAKTLKAYTLSHKAENLCLDMFPRSRVNDESDACRHFVWAGLMNKNLGAEFARKVLDAHEQNSLEPEAERGMDLANNRLGILRSSELMGKGGCSEETLMGAFRSALESGSLVILKKKGVPKP